jgi:beta-galactosidase
MYLGVDYYPEHWDIGIMEQDMQRIKDMGSNIIRIGEFAWHMMEKNEGVFDFSFFDMVIEKAAHYKLNIMFGTPTATFPAWLAYKHPSILSEDEYNNKRAFGGRRQYCFNSEIYSKYSNKLVEKLVSHYKDEQNIIAWQIDNEFGHEGSDQCFCQQCHQGFQKFLKDKYKQIDELNKIYGTIFWGQTYNSFDEIPMPTPTITTHNPTLKLDWARFRCISINNFAKKQIDLVKKLKGKHQRITHNFYGGFFDRSYDQNIMAEHLDFAAYDNYPVWGGLKEPIRPEHIAMTLDYIRGLKNENFWIVEELMGAQGHDVIGYLPRPGQSKMWAYQAMAHGCQNMLFFRYRAMTSGAEQFCLGIIDQNNQKGRKYYEAQSFMKDIRKYEDIIHSRIISDIAVLYDFDNIWSWHYQKQSSNFDFTKELLRLYAPFYKHNANIDVISTKRDFMKYKVLVVPVMQIIDEKLADRFEEYAAAGGTIIFSYRAGIKDRNNNIYFDKYFPCNIREIAGIRIEETESLLEDKHAEVVGIGRYKDNSGQCKIWRDMIIPETAEGLYKYKDQFYSDNLCITVNQYKGGKVYYVGGGVDAKTLDEIALQIIQDNKIRHINAPKGLEVFIRDYNDNEWLFISNHGDKEVIFKGSAIEPYGTKVMQL